MTEKGRKTRLRHWLILKLAGTDLIMLNAIIEDGVLTLAPPDERVTLVRDCVFVTHNPNTTYHCTLGGTGKWRLVHKGGQDEVERTGAQDDYRGAA